MPDYDYGACWEANAETWAQLVRVGYDVSRGALHMPSFLRMFPDVTGLRGLGVGCGEGTATRKLARRGTRMVGVDIAPTFIRYAVEEENREPLGILYLHADAAALSFPDTNFDFAAAFISLMDVQNLAGSLKDIHHVLIPEKFLQFTILHPCFTLHNAASFVTMTAL